MSTSKSILPGERSLTGTKKLFNCQPFPKKAPSNNKPEQGEFTMAKNSVCPTPEEHHLHLCELKAKPHNADFDKLYDKPKFVCSNCGGRVNKAENVCAPKPL
jgi:hypothetical protein